MGKIISGGFIEENGKIYGPYYRFYLTGQGEKAMAGIPKKIRAEIMRDINIELNKRMTEYLADMILNGINEDGPIVNCRGGLPTE